MFRVIPVHWVGPASIRNLFAAVLQSGIVFVWGMTGQAAMAAFVLAKALRKKTVFIAGGSEVAVQRDIHGSDVRAAIRFMFAKAAIRFVDCVVAVSKFTLGEVLTISRPKRFSVICHGIDARVFDSRMKYRDTILTVAASPANSYLWRKGIDRFLKLASLLPHRTFVLAGEGSSNRIFRQAKLPNVTTTGKLVELTPLYRRARIYCQLSRHEGFGVAVAEAMACKCVPIVSDSGALPEVVGECGVVVPNGDPTMSAKAIEEKWDQSRELGELARQRVVSLYSIERRISGFKTLLNDLGCF
jgi:glycosyltransferase involved in cell wall biosynthesis